MHLGHLPCLRKVLYGTAPAALNEGLLIRAGACITGQKEFVYVQMSSAGNARTLSSKLARGNSAYEQMFQIQRQTSLTEYCKSTVFALNK